MPLPSYCKNWSEPGPRHQGMSVEIPSLDLVTILEWVFLYWGLEELNPSLLLLPQAQPGQHKAHIKQDLNPSYGKWWENRPSTEKGMPLTEVLQNWEMNLWHCRSIKKAQRYFIWRRLAIYNQRWSPSRAVATTRDLWEHRLTFLRHWLGSQAKGIVGMCGITGQEVTIKNAGSRHRRKSEFPEMGSNKTMRSLIHSN